MESAGVRLIIKAPNQQIEDQIISCELGWTIRKLKDYLAEVYPSKPKTKDQKLIYSGQLLKDSVFLKDVLRSYEDTENQPFTVHLVCATNKMGTVKKPEKSTKETPESTKATPESTKASSSADRNPPDSRSDRLDSPAQETISTQPTAQAYSTQSFYGQLNTQQIAWMQQAYTHYLTQYMQLMAAQGVHVPNSIPYMRTLNPNLNNLANNSVNNNNINQNEEVEQPRQVPQDAADLGAGDEAGVGLNRDWLDFFYMLSRIVVLFSIVYFYSSPIRFLIVAFLGFAMYLYQGGFFRVHPVLLPENNNARQNNNQVAQNEAAGQGAPPQEGQETRTETEGRTNPNEENETERPGALAFTWSFFSSFFASLIPDQPNVL